MLDFFLCETCGNLFFPIKSSGVTPSCRGSEMTKLYIHFNDWGSEKHLPLVTSGGSIIKVSVGDLPHPMGEEHRIEWILLETDRGAHLKRLSPEADKAEAEFVLSRGEKAVAVYAYCNIHGLWMLAM